MGIDRIGKGSIPPPATPAGPKGAGSAGAKEGAARPFEVKKPGETERAGRAAPVEAAAASPLEQLRTGAIDLNGYLDMKVDAATTHLQGLSPKELGAVKKMLRDQIASDPALSDLVKQATGSAPLPPED